MNIWSSKSPLYASTLPEVVQPASPPFLGKHWHHQSRAHLQPGIWPFKNIQELWWQTFWGATMLALLGCEFSLWRGGWGPITDCDRVDWGPMKSRTCKWKGKSIFLMRLWPLLSMITMMIYKPTVRPLPFQLLFYLHFSPAHWNLPWSCAPCKLLHGRIWAQQKWDENIFFTSEQKTGIEQNIFCIFLVFSPAAAAPAIVTLWCRRLVGGVESSKAVLHLCRVLFY